MTERKLKGIKPIKSENIRRLLKENQKENETRKSETGKKGEKK